MWELREKYSYEDALMLLDILRTDRENERRVNEYYAKEARAKNGRNR